MKGLIIALCFIVAGCASIDPNPCMTSAMETWVEAKSDGVVMYVMWTRYGKQYHASPYYIQSDGTALVIDDRLGYVAPRRMLNPITWLPPLEKQ